MEWGGQQRATCTEQTEWRYVKTCVIVEQTSTLYRASASKKVDRLSRDQDMMGFGGKKTIEGKADERSCTDSTSLDEKGEGVAV